MHCLDPSCVSACIVGALTKAPDGAVVYNPTICIGLPLLPGGLSRSRSRPTSSTTPLTPRVRKCEFCADRAKGTGAEPGVRRRRARPRRSCSADAADLRGHGQGAASSGGRTATSTTSTARHEVGGTSWLYLTGRPVQEIGLLRAARRRRRRERTEAIQHGIFKYGIIPVAFYGAAGGRHVVQPPEARRRTHPGIGEPSRRRLQRAGTREVRDDARIHDDRPHRVTKPFFTFGTLTLLLFMGVGFAFGITRLLLGLGSVTNLDNHNPWGIWISFDVACGVALAAGGFTTAALVDIFGRQKYKPLLRPAILTAFLGYLWVAIALSFDLGRYWNIWRPIFNWQGNSVLFEVGHVRHRLPHRADRRDEPVDPGRAEGADRRERAGAPRSCGEVEKPILTLYAAVRIALPLFIVAGVVLSFMHQSSLGTLMLIAPTKMSPLWNTPILPVLFLLSAIMVGFPMVILESIYANISFGRNPEMDLLTPLARIIPWFIGAYGLVKIGDLVVRPASWTSSRSRRPRRRWSSRSSSASSPRSCCFLNKAVRRSDGLALLRRRR